MGLSDKLFEAYMAANMKHQLDKASPAYHPEDHNMHSRQYYTNTGVVIVGAGFSGTLMIALQRGVDVGSCHLPSRIQ